MPAQLAQHLIARQLVSSERMHQALHSQAVAGGGLDTSLLEQGFISEPLLLQALGQVSGLRAVNLLEFQPNLDVAALIPPKLAERMAVVPLSVDGGTVHLASAYPVPLKDLEEIGFLLNKRVEVWVAPEVRIRDWLTAVYGLPTPPRFSALLSALDPDRPEPLPKPLGSPGPAVTARPRPEAPPLGLAVDEPIPLSRVKPVLPDTVPEWDLEQARDALRSASLDREKIFEVALRFGLRTFDFVVAFVVVRGAAVGWDVRGEGARREQVTQMSIPLDANSVFRTAAFTRRSYLGPTPSDALTRHFLEGLGRNPRSLFLYPVEVKGRLVALLYGDRGNTPLSQRRLSEYVLFCEGLAAAIQELILFRKRQSEGGAPGGGDGAPTAGGWSPSSRFAPSLPGRAVAVAFHPPSVMERPPPDYTTLLRKLTGPDPAPRARAMAELAQSPEASARQLAAIFPGPTAWSRLPVMELPEADELGPVPAALARLGRAGAQALRPLLDSSDVDVRYLALLTAGNLPYSELIEGVLRSLFDFEPDIASAARAAARALRRLPRFEPSMKELRRELASPDPLRQALAARALGVLQDRDAVEPLIALTGNGDNMVSQAAAEALTDITRATLGTDARAWSAWWNQNRGRRRAEWLVDALAHPELEVRLGAIEELSKALNDHLGYFADAPPRERAVAIQRWQAQVRDTARGRRLDV
ncbi:MAG TPA: HEAT repeat domain-containing protein [Myxococcaceae bacterium]|nr:HEAT repeat domain-containing protein [Myxococcaceae bacterium]